MSKQQWVSRYAGIALGAPGGVRVRRTARGSGVSVNSRGRSPAGAETARWPRERFECAKCLREVDSLFEALRRALAR